MRTHGFYGTPTYSCWIAIRRRCSSPKCREFARYGGRGIAVCDRWKLFANFLADMGPRPSSAHSVDRIDNDQGYEPSNCRWATHDEQQNNRRNNHKVEYRGQMLTIRQAHTAAGSPLNFDVVRVRIASSWPVEDALAEPLHTRLASL